MTIQEQVIEALTMQGVHHDIVAIVNNNIDEFPLNWHPFLRHLSERAAKNIERAELALSALKNNA